MLDSPAGTASTFWEGMSSTGTFSAYNGSYTSLAHGWSTGPTGALTSYVLGIAPTTAAGAAYQVIPHPGDLTHVEGSLTVAAGKAVSASYSRDATGDFSLQVNSSASTGSAGVLAVPVYGQALPALPGTWTTCAAEGGTCAPGGPAAVAFGANGSFRYATASGSVPCSDGTFGDPDPGVVKTCYSQPAVPAAGGWQQCAAENGTCSFTGTMTVAFGASGQYKYATLTGGTACTDGVFGDPLYGNVKACYVQ